MNTEFSVQLDGRDFSGVPYRVHLGPYKFIEEANHLIDTLVDTRVGEQLISKFGVERLSVVGLTQE